VPSDLICHIGDIHHYLTGTSRKSLSEPLNKKEKNAVRILLNSTGLVGFALGIGLWLSLSAHRPQSLVDNEIHCAKAVHSATTGAVVCKEGEITFVMRCMAQDFLSCVPCQSSQTTSIMHFFKYSLKVERPFQEPCPELHEYAKLRFQGVGHDEALLREFPAMVGTWLFLSDMEQFVRMVARMEANILNLDFQRTFGNFEKIFFGLAKMIHMRLLQAEEAEKWVAKLCALHFKSSIASQCLFMSIQGDMGLSNFLNSLDVLQSSLRQVVSELKIGLEQSI
jgi:hypothetical protein